MDKDFLIQLTNNLYRLTLLFPKKEPMRYKMRELADDILNDFYKDHNPEIFKSLEVLDSYFEVAKNQNWVSADEILKLQGGYSKLKEQLESNKKEITEVRPLPEVALEKPVQNLNSLADSQVRFSQIQGISGRHGKILEFLKENEKAQVWQLKQVFPELSKRTLRRDFEFLLKQGKIERIGERNETFYQLRRIEV